jgi:glycosyltransferase involved in cell wall biosynthesis
VAGAPRARHNDDVRPKRIGILIVAYNASSTLSKVLSRIPADFRRRVSDVLVFDDHSDDATYLVGLGYQQLVPDLPLTVIRHDRNLGYGGNQKSGYRWAIEHGLDIVVLLHGDGQYAPEFLPQMVAPLEHDECDAVFGSRMLERGAARRGGMPLYKYVGNRILTRVQNAMAGTSLSEWHSGYRAYSVAALDDIPFDRNSDGFDFDTEIIVQLHEASKRICEIPVPTYYGDEICRVDGLRYARDVTIDTAKYRLHRMGLGSGELAFARDTYELKVDPRSSHGRIVEWLRERPPSRILDLGCSHGALGEQLRAMGHHVTGVDVAEHDDVAARVDTFVAADLNHGIPDEAGDGYDVVVAADVLEHVRHPERLLADARGRLRPGGAVIASIPNFAHWYPRLRVALGRFDYDRRGILDRGHMRFFTRRSFEHLVAEQGLAVRRRAAVGMPFEVVERGRGADSQAPRTGRGPAALLRPVDSATIALRPTLFAYQFVYELSPAAGPIIELRDADGPHAEAEPLSTRPG